MKCNICGQPTARLFSAQVLGRYDVAYLRCEACGFIQTEKPFWLAEAYTDPVSVYDVWAVSRPLEDSKRVARLVDRCFSESHLPCLDFGGGTGIFTRRMRDLGYAFLRADAYSPNLYARLFDLTDYPRPHKFSLLTCFEVFEHLPAPREELAKMFELSDSIFFSTTLVPGAVKTAADWNYFAPFHGQHVSFYTVAALQKLATDHGCRLFTNGMDQHLFTRADLRLSPSEFDEITSGRPSSPLRRGLQKMGHALIRLAQPSKGRARDSLTFSDFNYVCEKRAPVESTAGHPSPEKQLSEDRLK